VSETPLVRGRESFESFYRREYRSVLGLAIVLSGSPTAAEELTQEAFVAALRRWDHGEAIDNPDAWVRRVVANRAVSAIRRRVAEAKALVRSRPSGDAVEGTVGPALDAEVWREVRRLPRRQAQAIALSYLDDLSRREVATILGCSEETVKTHLARGRATLAKRLSDWEGGGNER
jgi:RNA polymerase sigma-70 factor (sigma-E family)